MSGALIAACFFALGAAGLVALSRRRHARDAAAAAVAAPARLEAAVETGAPALQALVDDAQCPDAVRAEALGHLVRADSDRCPPDELVRVLERSEGALAAAAARALGRCGDHRHQWALVSALARGDLPLAEPVLEALGAIGDRAALSTLRRLGRGYSLTRPEVGAATDIAIARIEARFGALEGRVSLAAEAPDGGLSDPPADRGLSLESKPRS